MGLIKELLLARLEQKKENVRKLQYKVGYLSGVIENAKRQQSQEKA